jgi:hypothetical protein
MVLSLFLKVAECGRVFLLGYKWGATWRNTEPAWVPRLLGLHGVLLKDESAMENL